MRALALATLLSFCGFSLPAVGGVDDPFDPASCPGRSITRRALDELLLGGVERFALGRAAFVWRPETASVELLVSSPTAGDVALPLSGDAVLTRSPDGPVFSWTTGPRRVTGLDGAFHDVSATVRCDTALLVGERDGPCAAYGTTRKLGAGIAATARVAVVVSSPASSTPVRVPFAPLATMTPHCLRLVSAAPSASLATLVRPPLFDFSLAALDATLSGLADYVYESKAPLFRRAADLAAQHPLPDGAGLRLFVMGVMRPAVESTTTRLFEERVTPAYEAALAAALQAAGLASVSELPRDAAVREASLWLLATALGLCKDVIAAPDTRAALDRVIAETGQALARGAPVDLTEAALESAATLEPVLAALAGAGTAEGPALVALALIRLWVV